MGRKLKRQDADASTRTVSAGPRFPMCPEDVGKGKGFGCPECGRKEVRGHPTRCAEHGEHKVLACCWCGEVYFSYAPVEHFDPLSHNLAGGDA